MRRAALLAALLIAGCGQASEEPTPLASGIRLPAPAKLVGEYRVAGIDGASLDAPTGIALSITAGRVSIEPACAAFVWSYAYHGGKLDIERRQEKLHHPPPPACEEPSTPELKQLASALDAVSHADRTPANGIELSGHGRSVLLFSQ